MMSIISLADEYILFIVYVFYFQLSLFKIGVTRTRSLDYSVRFIPTSKVTRPLWQIRMTLLLITAFLPAWVTTGHNYSTWIVLHSFRNGTGLHSVKQCRWISLRCHTKKLMNSAHEALQQTLYANGLCSAKFLVLKSHDATSIPSFKHGTMFKHKHSFRYLLAWNRNG